MAALGPPALASDVRDDPTALQQPPPAENGKAKENEPAKQNDEPGGSGPPSAPGVCAALATAATANDLPVDFFNRLIWQESRFRPDAISPKGAQGIAQFMPETARLS
jgi:soluble lytic murein transglycosylase-like protein